MKFNQDLIDGKAGEKAIAEYLIKEEGWELLAFNRSSDKEKLKHFDIAMWDADKNLQLIEVKTDRWETFNYETDNIFVEFMCSGTYSGIKTTKSTLYAFYFPDYEEAFLIETDKLKADIRTPGVVHHVQTGAGDDDKVTSYLINRREHRDLFTTYKVPKKYHDKYL